MLDIFPRLLLSAVVLSPVLAAPLELLIIDATTSLLGATTATFTDNVPANTNDFSTNIGGQIFPQTTMPTGAATTGGDQTTTGSTGTGNCPTIFSTPKCYRYHTDFPSPSQWISLPCMISHARPDMVGFSNDGPDEADNVISAVQAVSQEARIDPRIAFAVMLQESSGKVRPIIGDYGKSFGMFQVQIAGAALCTSYAKNTCPLSVITNMAEDGIYGHNGTSTPPQAPGIAYWLSAESGDVALAMRGYNTGSVPNRNDLTDATGTKSYVSDIANRLVGGLLGAQHQNTCLDS
ncbi:MAG: hypothetical protein Q9225_000472 [Loekoesia sp. 1 TL-2023]